MKNLLPFFLISTFLLLVSCKGEKKERMMNDVNLEEQKVDQEIISTFYNIPSPSEQLMSLKELDGKEQFADLLSTKGLTKLSTTKQRAIFFGALAADASYLASKSQKGGLMSYIVALESLAQELGFGDLYREDMNKIAADKNVSSDSLFVMADKFYLKAFDRLIESDKGGELGLMLFGGWIETMHIALQSSYGFDKSLKINQFVAEQKLVAENLISYLLDYQENEDIAMLTEKVSEILNIYEEMDCEYGNSNVVQSEGRIELSGGTKCKLTIEVFESLKKEMSNLRKSFATL